MRTASSTPNRFALALLLTTAGVYLFSRLTFSPVPWPDASAFYLPALELFHWPPVWRNHAQAAFVPSYDTANYNMTWGMPVLVGLAHRLGLTHVLDPSLALRAVCLIGLCVYAWLLWAWVKLEAGRETVSKKSVAALAAVIALAALWDPILRWGTLVVRPEIWIGMTWLGVLIQLDRLDDSQTPRHQSRVLWSIAAFLALGAYFHFIAILMVPATCFGLLSFRVRRSWARLWGVAWRTLIFLSPWIFYILIHFPLFLDQMDVQFHRLNKANWYMRNWYVAFHSLFLDHGSAEGIPKFYNVAKALVWGLIFFLSAFVVGRLQMFLGDRRQSLHPLRAMVAGGIAFWTAFYIWYAKPEVWFITPVHATLWSWAAATLIYAVRTRTAWLRKSLAWGCGALAALGGLAQANQLLRTPHHYTWSIYQDWVQCLEKTILAEIPSGAPSLWQPHVPDVLVDLATHHPDWDLTRALDFSTREDLAFDLGRRVDVILLSRQSPNHGVSDYRGPVRPQDEAIASDPIEVPFGRWTLNQPRKNQVCQVGPFWAILSFRDRRPLNRQDGPVGPSSR